ncbi:phosphate signaling complex protein PhoU [Sciscionella sediminilitoris]|uniref:phosphate signaling complex protein PhoU n=1 Tax=Sciscionella sediminilitoris TaxID=1445613 RepID=UPI0004DF4C0C|nr:phosphate signaling complex protein PhoU [Sciscionella sp. SE31]
MREAYRDQLGELADLLAGMCASVAEAMERATQSLLDADLALAEQVIGADQKVDEARTNAEEQAYALLALQAPVASELRTVLAAMYAAESLERMGDLAKHIAGAARRRHPDEVVPAEVRPYFAKMGEVGATQARRVEQVIRTSDVGLAKEVEEADDEVDELHRHLFTKIMERDWEHGVATAVDVTLLSRFYERFADHAVSVARRTVFVVTGEMPTGADAEQ